MAKTWTTHEIRDLREFWERGLSPAEIGALMGRTMSSIERKVRRLGLPAHGYAVVVRIKSGAKPQPWQLERSTTTKFLAKIQPRHDRPVKVTLPKLKFMEGPE